MPAKKELEGGLYRPEAVAKLLGISARRVQQLTQDGILPKREEPNGQHTTKGYDLEETVRNYIEFVTSRKRGASQSEAELKVKKLEAEVALKESQGELHQLKTAIASGEYISVEEVQLDYERFFVTFKKFAMNLPPRLIGMVSGQLDPTEARRLEKDLAAEVGGILEAFTVAGTEAKPVKVEKPKRGRPKKAPEN